MREGYKETEIGWIPEDWKVTSLQEIGTFKNGINKSKGDFGFGYPFINLNDVFGYNMVKNKKLGLVNSTPNERKEYELKEGDVLFVRSSVKPSGVGLTALVETDITDTVFSGFLIRFRDNGNLFCGYKKFCFYESGFRERLINKSTISANTNINQQALNSLLLAVPPLPEQQKIAEILSTVDEKIEVIGEQISQTRELKRGLMQRLLTKGIDHTRFKDSPLGEIPESWEVVELEDVFPKIVVGYVGSISKSYCEKDEGIPLIRTLNVRDGYFDPSGLQYVTNKFHQKNKKSWVENGDILIARVGANMGMTCKVSGLLSDANAANVIIIKNSDSVNSGFYAYFLSSNIGQNQMNSKGAGGAQAVLNTRTAQKLTIPLASLSEQQKIANILSTVDEKLKVLQSKKQQYQELKRGLMQQLLTGKVCVTNLLTKAVPA